MQDNGNQQSDEAQAAYAVAEQMIAEALASGAEELNFSDSDTQALTKIPPEISKLTHLISLNLENTDVSDISVLQGMTAMNELILWDTQVSDISVLEDMKAMTWLDLGSTQVSDISVLEGMTGITNLNLTGIQVSDISVLKGMTEMTSLNLWDTHVSDISVLQGMTRMSSLSLWDTQVTDISVLQGMTKMTELDLGGTQVSDIYVLQGMTEMTSLKLWDTQVTDISVLQGMTKMTELDLGGTQVSDISVLQGMAWMTELDLGNTQVSDISVLQGMTRITLLHLTGSKVNDISVLQGMTDMYILYLEGSKVSDISVLGGMKEIALLKLDDTQVSNLAPISNLTSLIPKEDADPWGGLSYRDTPATAQDAVLRELSQIKDSRERTEKTLAYLRGEGRGDVVDAVPPKDDPAAPVYTLPVDGPMHSDPEPPEGGDADQQALLEEVRIKVQVMLDEIGGHNEPVVVRLKDNGLKYQRQVAKPLDGIALRLLWSAANSLRLAYHADNRAAESARINDELPPRISAALRDLVETHGLFIMGFENAAAIEVQMRGFTDGPRNEALREVAQEIVAVLKDRPDALAVEDYDAVEEDSVTSAADGPDGAMAEVSLIGRLWNMLGAAGRTVVGLAKNTVKGGATVLLSHDFIQIMLGNEALIWKFLQAAQGEWAIWFPRIMDIIKAMSGA